MGDMNLTLDGVLTTRRFLCSIFSNVDITLLGSRQHGAVMPFNALPLWIQDNTCCLAKSIIHRFLVKLNTFGSFKIIIGLHGIIKYSFVVHQESL